MARKRYTAEQIIRKLREAEVLISKGMTAAEAIREAGGVRAHILPLEARIWRHAC